MVNHSHVLFRIFEFATAHLIALQVLYLFLYAISGIEDYNIHLLTGAVILTAGYNFFLLYPYTKIFGKKSRIEIKGKGTEYSLLCINVYQPNTKYGELIKLIEAVKPDIVLTIESNKDWEEALQEIEQDYPYAVKVPLENTYGMHLYSKVKFQKTETHFFISDDLPSIEAHFEDEQSSFVLFGVHPPPPSPTEEPNSKERDGELLAIAKYVRDIEQPLLVAGDFNTVAWGKAPRLFRKITSLLDPRVGRGLVSTFHAKYPLFRFPIDQMYHSKNIKINTFESLRNVGSDHLPLFCTFEVFPQHENGIEAKSGIEREDVEEIHEIIEEGKEEEGDREDLN
ncbi:endonuclease/exonuclease/phosphatase family protein [bacterium]|nr:endonuclease/exonuclease/phosphatase family protein [bacterium]